MLTEVETHNLHKPLKDFFGFNGFKGTQEVIINNILNKQDTFVIMPTGGGKSLCYQLPALVLDGTAIVVSPLIAFHWMLACHSSRQARAPRGLFCPRYRWSLSYSFPSGYPGQPL